MRIGTAVLVLVMALVAVPAAFAGIVTTITIGDYANPSVLDFNSATLGPISGTDPLFTTFGISSVSYAVSSDGDTYNVRTNSSRALWGNTNGLLIVDPGAGGLGVSSSTYTIDLSGTHSRFGVASHDQGGTMTVAFFSGGSPVGSIGVTTGTDLSQFYFSNTDTFDRVTVSHSGFAIDNITIEAVPEPGTFALLGAGLALLGITARRRRKK